MKVLLDTKFIWRGIEIHYHMQNNFQGGLKPPIVLQRFFKGNWARLSHFKFISWAMGTAYHIPNIFQGRLDEPIASQIFFMGDEVTPSHPKFFHG